jgi:hypothetical protein
MNNKKISAVEKILSEKGLRVEFLTMQDKSGTDCFAYILMSEADYPKYAEALKTGYVDPEKYGAVFAYGLGKEPSEEIKQQVLDLLN